MRQLLFFPFLITMACDNEVKQDVLRDVTAEATSAEAETETEVEASESDEVESGEDGGEAEDSEDPGVPDAPTDVDGDGYSTEAGDCDDGDPLINPGATEYCDGVDNDCNGSVDEPVSADAQLWYPDVDSDGYGSAGADATPACEAPSGGHVLNADDCDDARGGVHPGAAEICDDIDNDCDGLLDAADGDLEDAPTWYADLDLDGYGGMSARPVTTCDSPGRGYVTNDDDCDDSRSDTHPGAADIWTDGVDSDCAGESDSFDYDGDGINEIEGLALASFTENRVTGMRPTVMVLVEKRLLDEVEDSAYSVGELEDRLVNLEEDLQNEGYDTMFMLTEVYGGVEHQDGKTILAMRELLKTHYSGTAAIEGVLLVGAFPDATLVRRWAWDRGGRWLEIDGETFDGEDGLRIVPEMIDARADIVLADMDGNWEELYYQEETDVLGFEAIPTNSDFWETGYAEAADWEVESHAFEDFFWIQDDDFSYSTHYEYDWAVGTATLVADIFFDTEMAGPELSASDRLMANPIARPEIQVSRINALHVAVEPSPDLEDDWGRELIDVDGVPQSVDSDAGSVSYVRDASLERQLVIEYLDRNHAFRTDALAWTPFRAAAISYPEDGFPVASRGTYVEQVSDHFGTTVLGPEDATLEDYVDWLAQPARVRMITAHSNYFYSAFGSDYDPEDLAEAAGGNPWRWTESGGMLVPSFEDQGVSADLYLYRTMYENEVQASNASSFVIHTGCMVNKPFRGGTHAYTDSRYGELQNAEGQLFYLNTLAMISRTKTYNDQPEGLSESLGAHANPQFGEIWPGTFEADATSETLTAFSPSQAKRAYNWGFIGDWTLRLRYD